MEYGTIERDIHVDAPPPVVFEVVSRPEHMREWWPDEASFEPLPGAPGEIAWVDDAGERKAVDIAIVDVDPPKRFSFRWCIAGADSLLVTFDLTPAGDGTLVRMTETGFREMGWEIAVLEETYNDHANGWDHFIPLLGKYVARVASP